MKKITCWYIGKNHLVRLLLLDFATKKPSRKPIAKLKRIGPKFSNPDSWFPYINRRSGSQADNKNTNRINQIPFEIYFVFIIIFLIELIT